MDTLRELVRNLAVIIIFSTFIEMLLPNGQMKHYTRLVLGLFVILLVLNPVLAFMGQGLEFPSQGWTSSPAKKDQLEEILGDARQISGQSQESLAKQYAEKVQQQIAALVRLAPEVEEAQVSVTLEDSTSQFEMGAIRQVTVTASIRPAAGEDPGGSRNIEKVGQVRVEKGQERKGSEKESPVLTPRQIERRIQSIVGDFYGLKPDQVFVKLEN